MLDRFRRFLHPTSLFHHKKGDIQRKVKSTRLLPLRRPRYIMKRRLRPLRHFRTTSRVYNPTRTLLIVNRTKRRRVPSPRQGTRVESIPYRNWSINVIPTNGLAILLQISLLRVRSRRANKDRRNVRNNRMNKIVKLRQLANHIRHNICPLNTHRLRRFYRRIRLPRQLTTTSNGTTLLTPMVTMTPSILRRLLQEPFHTTLDTPHFKIITMFTTRNATLRGSGRPSAQPIRQTRTFRQISRASEIAIQRNECKESHPSTTHKSNQ